MTQLWQACTDFLEALGNWKHPVTTTPAFVPSATSESIVFLVNLLSQNDQVLVRATPSVCLIHNLKYWLLSEISSNHMKSHVLCTSDA